jgi:hypothetical protein
MLIMRDELEQIVEVLSKFEGATYVELTKSDESGIGYILKAAIPLDTHGLTGTFTTGITGPNDW